MNDAERRKIIKEADSRAEAAEELGLSVGHVYNEASRLGLATDKRGIKPSEEKLASLKEEHDTYYSIAEEYNVCYDTVAMWMHEEGLTERRPDNQPRPGVHRDPNWLAIGKMLEIPLRRQAELADVAKGTISLWRKKYDIKGPTVEK